MESKLLSSLIRRDADGDMDALEKIFYGMKDSIFSFVLMYTGNRQLAEDILQETMLQVHYSSKNFRRFENPKAWILAIARNSAVSAIRKTSRETDLDETIIHIPDGTDFELEVSGRSNISSLLSHLSQTEKQIVILHAISELKHKEIAALLDIPLGTVCRKYNESIKKLQQLSISNI